MANFWEDLKNNITEWSIVASEKAEEFTHTSKLRIDVLQLERKLSSLYVKLGLYVFSKTKEKNVLNFVGDKKYLSIIDSIETIKLKIADIKKEINHDNESENKEIMMMNKKKFSFQFLSSDRLHQINFSLSNFLFFLEYLLLHLLV